MHTVDYTDEQSRIPKSQRVPKMPALPNYIRAVVLLLAWQVIPTSATPNPVGPKLLGPGSCSSSNCHGSVKPHNSSNVLQNEYITWSKHDRHARAYLSLQTADSKKIARNLGIGDPTKEPLCLACHTVYSQGSTPKGDAFRLEDGVSCEGCHGAAEGYLKSHVIAGATHADNVAHGLTDLSNLDTRATLCLSCHFGTEDKTVNHSLYGAGHPRLTFELDTFGILQPKHWVVDGDYERRKGPYVPIRVWMIGQLHHAEAALEALQSPTRSKSGSLPELSLFDCFSCHHTLSEQQWKKRTYGDKPGRLRLNLPSLVTLQVVTAALDAPLGDQLRQQVQTLHDTYLNGGAEASIETTQRLIDTHVAPLLARLTTNLSANIRILSALTRYAAENQWLTFEVAEQLAMGIQATIASSPELAQRYDKPLKGLFATLKNADSFKPDAFTREAGVLLQVISKPNGR
jgi:hypothetical protein